MHEPIAIVGIACRFPGQVTDTGKLWELMMESRSAFSEVPPERFSQDAFYHSDSKNNGTFNAKGGHFLHDDISLFDATFFNIAPAEAKAMDPQLRLLLEVSYEAFENGGFTLDQIRGSNTGVYTALYNRDYEKMMFRDPENMPFYAATGNGEAMFSNRLSYFFDLKGPLFTLDTGCSGSLVALHSACTSLWAGESQQSVVAASNLILDPLAMGGPSFMQFLSPDGQSYSFDSRACGYGRGEGTACAIVKPLSKALSDGDNIRSIIRSCVTNQDGRTPGITMPDLNAQKSLIEKAYFTAGLDPRDTVYAEAHGSGTAAGDDVESAALGAVLCSKRPRYDPLIIGSIKTNIGHLENASGLAALIKTVSIIENGCIPPNTNFESPNPSIDFNHLNLKVATAPQSLSHTESRQVSISSFGYGGTNCHVVLDKGPTKESTPMPTTQGQDVRRPCGEDVEYKDHLFVFSARSKSSRSLISSQTQEYLNRLNHSSQQFLRSLAYTLSNKRSQFRWRQALVADSLDGLQRSLENSAAFHHTTSTPDPCFIFTGQGSQWLGMGKELFQSSLIFRDSILAAERHLLCLGAGWRLTDELLSPPDSSSLNTAQVDQPACTATQLALVNLLSSWNVRPRAVVGHSSGEIAAAYACDAISFDDALLTAYARGECAAELAKQKEIPGGMLAVGLSEDVAGGYLDLVDEKFGTVKVACINSPQSVTLSGDEAAIVDIHNLLQKEKVFVRRLPVDVAYHSHHMTRIAKKYLTALARLGSPTTSPSVSFFSSVEGRLIDTKTVDRDYWVKNLVSPVLFSEALGHLCREISSDTILLEVGPHSGLKEPVRQCLDSRHGDSDAPLHYTSMLIRNQSARKTTLLAAGELFIRGCNIHIDMVNFQTSQDMPKIITELPPYPWDHSTSYWHEGRLSYNYRKRQEALHELLGVPAPDSSIFEPRWRKYIRLAEMPWLSGHKVQNRIVFPGAGYLCMAFEAGARYFTQSTSEANNIESITLSEVSFTQPLILADSQEAVELMTVLRPSGNYTGRDLSHRHEFIIYSAPDATKVVGHCRGFISILSKIVHSAPVKPVVDSNAVSIVSPGWFYEEVRTSCGLEYSGCFSGISSISAGIGSSQTTITASEAHQRPFVQPWGLTLHPAALDACMQSVLPAVLAEPGKKRPLVLSAIKEVARRPRPPRPQMELENSYNVTCRVSRRRKKCL